MRLARASKSVSETHRLESWTKDHADHAIIEILDFTLKPLPAIEEQGFDVLLDRWALIANVSGRLMLETCICCPGPENIAELVEAYFFAHIKLD
jgi:hypothetical protein